ncbi:MAG: penicillin-binding protein 2 [Elusimicrobiota bacterium]
MPGKKYYFWWKNQHSRRFTWLKVSIVVFWGIFIFRLFYLQLIEGNYYWMKAENNRLQYYRLQAPRGLIFDRNGTKLVGNQPRYSLYVSMQGLLNEEKRSISRRLSEITGINKEKILERFSSGDRLPFSVVKLISHLSSEEIARIEENIHHLPHTSIQIEHRRRYPFGKNGSHILGYLGKISNKSLNEMKKYGYRLRDEIGKCGVEKKYDLMVRGEDGYSEVEVEVSGRQQRVIKTCDAKIGNNLLLTIDWDLQETAMKAMGDKEGAVVAMDPGTGEILVWLSKPGFDPEDFTLPLTADKAEELFKDPRHPLYDRVIQGQYAPGSIFKLITALAALEEDEENVEQEFTCDGAIVLGYDRRVFRCWKDKHHGKLKLLDAIANSCNVYFYQLGIKTGAYNIYRTAKKMGLGKPAQNMFEKEKSGNIPDARWKKEYFGSGWYPGDTANMSVGQGYVLVNPLQLLRMVSAIAMKGMSYEPYLLKLVISPDRKVILKNTPKLEEKINISEAIFDKIIDGMERVTKYGTAQFLNLPLEVASKTGTAESPGGEDNSWYVCFAPVDDPQIAIVVLVENGGYGSVAAMPVAREILKKKFLAVN